MNVTRNNFALRQLFALRMLAGVVTSKLATAGENMGHLFFHLTSRNGHIGYIDIDVDEELADGLIRYRQRDEYGHIRLVSQPFRISNRWLMRNRNAMTARALWQIRTDANTILGMDVHSVVLGNYSHNRQEFMPFNIGALPADHVIAKRHARMKYVQDTLARLFPARAPANGLTREDICELIVKKA